MKPPGRATLLLWLTACGGHVGGRISPEVTADGQGGTKEESPGVAASAGYAPESFGGDGGGDAALAVGAGGGVGAVAHPLIGSATRYCENDLYCFGLECYAPHGLEERVCLSACRADADCGEREVCLQSTDLAGGCYRRCDVVSDCDYDFACFDFANDQRMLVCFPTSWAERWARAGL